MWVPTFQLLIDILEQITGDDTFTNGALGQCSIGLIRAPIAPTPTTPFSAVQEANYDGYQRIAGVLSDASIFEGQNGKALAVNSSLIWQPMGSDTPNTIYGHMLLSGGSASPTLMAVELFDQPIPLTNPLTLITDTPIFGLDPAANYGMSSVSN